MFDNTNPYTLHIKAIGGIRHYYVSFQDGQATFQETEVSRSVYLEFCRFIKQERNLCRWNERHTEHSELTDETLYRRTLRPPKSLKEIVCDSQRDTWMRQIIADLPEIQQCRFTLYYDFGCTYEQIAEMEGCTKRAAKFSIDIAKEKIRDQQKDF